MITISFVNESTADFKRKSELEKKLQYIFRYVNYGEISVLFDIQSPTSTIGKIDTLIFITIKNEKGNFYRTYPTRNYLYTLVIGIKHFEMDDILDVDSKELFNEEGSWNYVDTILAENRAFDSYCYSVNPKVRYFKSAFFYSVKAKNCSKTFSNEYIFFNQSIDFTKLLDFACQRCQSKKYKGALSMQFSDDLDMHSFIANFINDANEKTNQGILTRKKIDAICKDSKLIERILNSIGSRLCIVRGNAGSGKTLALMRIAYRTVSREFDVEGENRSHNVRLLTYNNMLVYDIKNTLKSMGEFTTSNLSVQTLHKFFYDMFKSTPAIWAKYAGEMTTRIDELIQTCDERITTINKVIENSFVYLKKKETSPFKQIEIYECKLNEKECTNGEGVDSSNYINVIQHSDKKEANYYFEYLKMNRRWEELVIPESLNEMKQMYILKKKNMAIESYLNSVFLTDYENILKDMYFLVNDPLKFAEEHNIQSKRDFFEFISTTDNIISTIDNSIVDESVKNIHRKVRWSHAILLDEAQDCSIYEKALLFQTRGSENIVIATGGKDQLIRKSQENDWTVLFGKPIEKESITLRRTNRRQKSNIVKFLNEFALQYNLDSQNIETPSETEDKGRVIIDLRKYNKGQISLEKMASLRNQGKDYGCSDYENLMVLLPRKGYTSKGGNSNQYMQMSVDVTDTITFTQTHSKSVNDFNHIEYEGTKDVRLCDCTTNSKGDLNLGQCDTRFLYYDSCRGLESWNVMCLSVDEFYYEKYNSQDAKNYAIELSGLIQEDLSMFQTHYAAIWCYMAFSRPMDTLFLSIDNIDDDFSKALLQIAKRCGNAVEIIE